MQFQTPPDFFDGHVHNVEVDDQGNGLTDDQGNPPHAHEVQYGAVQSFQTPDFVSQHPGELMEPAGQQQPPEAGTPAPGQDQQPQQGPPQEGAPPPPYEQVQAAVGLILEGRISPMQGARSILFTY